MFNKLSGNQVGQYSLGGPQALRILSFSQVQRSERENRTKGYYADATSSMGIPFRVGTITGGEGAASAWRNPAWIIVMTIPVRVVVRVFSARCLKCSLTVCSDNSISIAM